MTPDKTATPMTGRDIFEAVALRRESNFTDAEFERAVLDRQNDYPTLDVSGISASGERVMIPQSNVLPINGGDFTGEIRNMLSALARQLTAAQERITELKRGIEIRDKSLTIQIHETSLASERADQAEQRLSSQRDQGGAQ